MTGHPDLDNDEATYRLVDIGSEVVRVEQVLDSSLEEARELDRRAESAYWEAAYGGKDSPPLSALLVHKREAREELIVQAQAEGMQILICGAMMVDGTQCDFPRHHDSPHISVEQMCRAIASIADIDVKEHE